MLQQTQVHAVLPRFAPFLREFPTMQALATADERKVCEAWAGLGYYRRARHLHKAARLVVAQHHGRLPDTETGLRSLPGIGVYTAAAIASIAFGAREAAVDGNLVRVLARVFALPGRASDPALVREVRAKAQLLVDCPRPGDVNQALMDVGATLCRPESPACTVCPLRQSCQAFRQGRPTAFPVPKLKTPKKSLRVAFAWSERGSALLLEQRPLDGLWPGLWELPSASGPAAEQDLAERIASPLGPRLAQVFHQLTHRRVEANVYATAARKQAEQKWWKEPLAAPLSSLARKAILAARTSAALSAASPPPRRNRAASRP
jgi:A/G-specific adenine glycosylase